MPRTKKDTKSQQRVVIIIGVGIIAAVIGVSFVLMTQATSNENYIKTIQSISDQSRIVTQSYEDSIAKWQDGQISKEEMLEISERQLEKLDTLLATLNSMEPPEKFRVAHELRSEERRVGKECRL